MVFSPANQRLVIPAVIGTVLAVLMAVLLFQLGSGFAEAQEPPPNSPAAGTLTISGTVQAGETLTVDTSDISDGDGLVNVTFGYQWISNDGTTDTDITSGTSSTYIIRPWDLGKYIKVRVSFTDDAGNAETLTSGATAAVEASPNHPAMGWLKLLGMPEVGQAMRVVGLGLGYNWGIHDANGLTYATFSYQWIRSNGTTDVEIPNATGESYTLIDDDEGKTIKVQMSFIDDGANAEMLTSSGTTAVTARPSISDLGEPTDLTVGWSQGEEKGLELSWTAPEGTVTSYQILRLETPTQSRWWEPYPYECTPLIESHVSDTGGDATTYTDTDVSEGASYTYSVRAINSDGVGRKSSTPRMLQYRPHGYWPNGVPSSPRRTPTNLASSQIKNGIGLTWGAPEGEVTGYQILRRSPEQCDYGYRIFVENTNSTDTHWADRDVVAGTRYEYHVRAVNDVGAGRLDTRNSTSLRPTTLLVGPEPNNAATGIPTITGTAQVGEILTADPSGIADADGMHWARFSYQWLSGRDTEIEGATSSTYTPQASDANKVIKVRVDFMDDSGYEESLTSAATAAVSPNVSATGAPAITGKVEVGETLTSDTSGIADSDGLENVSYSYQWIRSDSTDDWDVDGATGSTYAVTAADADKAIKLRVNFTDDKGSVESLTSSATAVVPVEVSFAFRIEGTTVTCGSYNANDCDDPTSIDQGASDEIEVEIEVARSVNSQLYKFRFHVYQMEDSIGHDKTVEANDLCLGPGLADSISMEVTPDDGTGNFTYTDDGTIFNLCPAGTYQLYVPWYRYNYEDEEYEYAGTFRRYFFINGADEEATSIEQVKFITALYPDTPVSHGEVQIQGAKQSTVLNRKLTTFSLSIGGLVPDSDTETTDYVVRVRVIGDGGPGKTVPWCHVGNVGYSYLLKTVPEDGRWAMEAHVLGGCLRHQWPDTLQVELFDGSDLTDYSEPIVFQGSHIVSNTGELQYPELGTHEFIAGIDISLSALPNIPATGAPTISGTAEVGETLTADTLGITDADGLDNVSFSYQWLSRRDTKISGATGLTYILMSTDLGKTIKVRVSFTDDAGNEETLTSAATGAVEAMPSSYDRPHGLQATAGSGSITLTWEDPDTHESYGYYQILRHRPEQGEAEPLVYVEYASITDRTFVDNSVEPGVLYVYAVQAVKDPFGYLGPASTTVEVRMPDAQSTNTQAAGAPTITGTVQVSETLAADTSGITDADGLTSVAYSYQWIRNDGTTDTDIQGVTGSGYTLVDGDAGSTIKVRVSFSDDAGNDESLTSAATASVSPAAPGAPRSLDVQPAGTGKLSVSWQEPASNGGSSITAYTVQWKESSGSWDSASDVSSATTTTTSHTISRLSLDTEYSVRVIAGNSVGDGPESAEETATAVAQTSQQQVTTQNNPATGSPSINGTPEVGETLSVDTSSISDTDGLANVAFLYQWFANDGTTDTNIQDATGSTYTLASTDEGKTIKVSVSFTDDGGNDETVTSGATAEIEAALTAELQDLPVSGHDGQNAFTFRILFSEDVTVGYQALKEDSFEISEGTIKKAQRVNGRNDLRQFTVEPSSNLDVVIVLAGDRACEDDGAICTTSLKRLSNSLELSVPGPAPVNAPATGSPTISGTARVGETLTADPSGISDEDGLGNASFGFQWVLTNGNSDSDISGATSASYTLADSDLGKTVRVRVSFTDDAGNDETLTSAPTSSVEARPNSSATGSPSITGTAQVGETLNSDTSGISDSDGLSGVTYNYQWLADDADINGGTGSTYTLVGTDEGKAIKVQVSFTDDAGNGESLTSDATAAVAAEESQATEPPPAPTNLTAVVNTDGSVTLSWEAPDDDSVTGYQILRRRPTLDESTLLSYVDDTNGTATIFTDTSVTAGIRHVYRVKAINGAGLGPQSNYVRVEP